jgi:hypothetical protein
MKTSFTHERKTHADAQMSCEFSGRWWLLGSVKYITQNPEGGFAPNQTTSR